MPCGRDCGRVIWKDGTVTSTTAMRDSRSLAELTRAYFGEKLSMAAVFALVEHAEPSQADTVEALWVGSVGYARRDGLGSVAS
jgi:ribonuclease HII